MVPNVVICDHIVILFFDVHLICLCLFNDIEGYRIAAGLKKKQ